MATSFSSLPIIDLSILRQPNPSSLALTALGKQLYYTFTTTGFAYLMNSPISYGHAEVFTIAGDFFKIDAQEKWKLAKKSFNKRNPQTYRGYFPPQPAQSDNFKEGFEMGPACAPQERRNGKRQQVDLAEANVWPDERHFPGGRAKLEDLHAELQSLSLMLLTLLATSLGKSADHFSHYLVDSLSTLRLLHYPPQDQADSSEKVKLCCTPHTDSGLLTLLHQDSTGGLEVLNADGQWVPAPYVPGSIVLNIGDLMARVSGGRFVATMHRVRANSGGKSGRDGIGRLSVPFFFEPGEACRVEGVDGGEGVVYGEHVRKKMGTWIEFQDAPEPVIDSSLQGAVIQV